MVQYSMLYNSCYTAKIQPYMDNHYCNIGIYMGHIKISLPCMGRRRAAMIQEAPYRLIRV